MSLTIIIPTHNEEKQIAKCLATLLAQQKDFDFKIIIADGCSSDNTLETINKFAKEHKSIKVLINKNKDAASGRNLALANCNSQYIAFIDSDAYPTKNWIKTIFSSLHILDPENIIGFGGPDIPPPVQSIYAQIIDQALRSYLASGSFLNLSAQHKNISTIKTVKHIPTCNLIVKKAAFDKIGLFDTSFIKGQDLEWSTRAHRKGLRFLYLPQLVVYHHKKDNLVSLFKQVYKWATAKNYVCQKHGTNIFYLLPFAAALLILLSLICSIYIKELRTINLSLIIIYTILVLTESIRISIRNKFLNILYAILCFIIIHSSYILGFLHGYIKPLTSFDVQKAKKKTREHNLQSTKNK